MDKQQKEQQYDISEEELKQIQAIQQELIQEVARICRKCGTNLNHGACSCDTVELDPRMAVIAEIFKNSN